MEPLTPTFVENVLVISAMSITANERWRRKSQRFPYRLIFNLLPLHALVELRFEARLAWLRLTRRGIDPRFKSASDLLVNIGCGPRGLDGWVNIDCVAAPGVTCVRDCRTELPLPSKSAKGVFTEHFLEHLDYYEEAPKFLAECRRILRPGGTLRIIVPDGAKYLEAYCSGDLAAMETISPFMKWDRTCNAVPLSFMREVVPFRTRMEVVNFHFRQAGEHRFSYDFETLSILLEECGFESIVQMPFRKSELADLEIDGEVRALESLVVEASVPLQVVPGTKEGTSMEAAPGFEPGYGALQAPA